MLLPAYSLLPRLMTVLSVAAVASAAVCTPASQNFDNTIMYSDVEASKLTGQVVPDYPDDGYVSWMESSRSTYGNSVYVPSTANTCRGLGLHWSIDTTNSKISIAAAFYLGTTSTGGYGAIGFSETGGMRGADVAYFSFEDPNDASTITFTDAHILDSLTQPIPDEQQDWTLVDHTITDDGYLIFEMSRKLDTLDSFDRPFMNDAPTFVEDHKLIAAWNDSPTGTVVYHGQNRVRTSIQLFDSDDSDVAPGLDYDGFQKEMDERSDGSVDMVISSFTVPKTETYYHEECYSFNDMKSLGLFEDENSEAHVIGYEFMIDPETIKYVHHILVLGHYDPNSCYNYRATIFAWTPGDDFLYFPHNTGFRLGGQYGFKSFTLQYHFDNQDLDEGKVDRGSGIRIYTTTKETMAVEVGMMQVGDPFVDLSGEKIGKGLSKHELECPSSCTENRFNSANEITVIKEALHMHSYGKRIVNEVVRGDQVIHESFIDFWDFDQTGTPSPQQNPFQVKKGDKFRTTCYYDTGNNNNIEFGGGSNDEMCMSFILYYPKQAMETCGVDYFDKVCSAEYSGSTSLQSESEFERNFGRTYKEDESCSAKDHFEVTPSTLSSSVQIKIKPTATTLEVEMSVDKRAWLGFGINSEGSMLDSDAVIGSPSLGVAKYRLENTKDRGGVRKLEESRQTLVVSSFIQDSSDTSESSTMIFSKLLDDGDDIAISKEGPTTFIYAVGFGNDLTGHSEYGSFTIDLSSLCESEGGGAIITSSARMKKHIYAHGILGIAVFAVLMPIAILSARLRKWLDCTVYGESKMWFVIHNSLMCLSYILVATLFILAVYTRIRKRGEHFQGAHEMIGVLVLILVTIQLLVGIFRPPKLPPRAKSNAMDVDDGLSDDLKVEIVSAKRKQWKKLHVILGITILVLGIVEIVTGLQKFETLFGHSIL